MSARRDQALALGGIVQAAYLVQQVARKGSADAAALEASIRSIFAREAESTEAVFGGPAGVALGLKLLLSQLRPNGPGRNLELTRYVVAIMHHERHLLKRRRMLAQIGERLDKAQTQVNYFSVIHPNVIANLASIYSDTLGTFAPRIMVYGEQGHLANPENVNRVRALLLAGVRAAVLWRHRGGSRLKLLLQRHIILSQAQVLLDGIDRARASSQGA
jgi:high frequency lysogenization protein